MAKEKPVTTRTILSCLQKITQVKTCINTGSLKDSNEKWASDQLSEVYKVLISLIPDYEIQTIKGRVSVVETAGEGALSTPEKEDE